MSTLGSEQLNEHATQSSTSLVSRKRPRTSKIWDYMPVPWDTIILNSQGKVMWCCTHCRKEYQESSGTTVVTTHLSEAHSIRIGSVQAIKTVADHRNKLGIESIQAIESLKCWLGSGCIKWTKDF
jgi:hypothetical protein